MNEREREKSNITEQAAPFKSLRDMLLPGRSIELSDRDSSIPSFQMFQRIFLFHLIFLSVARGQKDFQSVCQTGIRQDQTK